MTRQTTWVQLFAWLVLIPGVNWANAQTPTVELVWRNSDRLPVAIQRADDQWLTVESPLFRDLFDISFSALDRIVFNADRSDDGKPTQPFAIQMVDGQLIYGTIKELDDKVLILNSPRTGDVAVLRDRIASIVRLSNAQSILAGRLDLAAWNAKGGEKKFWSVNERGQLTTQRKDTHLFLKSELPDNCLIELEIQWENKLDFSFALGVPQRPNALDQVPRLESWDDAIVFSHGDDFEIVMEEYDNTAKQLKFVIFWNQKSGEFFIGDARGQELATGEADQGDAKFSPGIYLANKSGDLAINSLSIRNSGHNFDVTQTSIQMDDGTSVNATLQSFDGTTWIAEKNDGESIEIPSDEFGGTFLFHPAVDDPLKGDKVKFADQAFLVGDTLQLSDDRLKVQSNISATPITLQLDRALMIQFARRSSSEQKKTQPEHHLHNAAGKMRGTLEPGSGEPGDILRWRLVGGRAPVPFFSSQANAKGARIVLGRRKLGSDAQEKWSDTLYLKNRDIVPCSVDRMDSETVFVNSFFENKAIHGSQMTAIHFQGGGDFPTEVSFDADSEWKISRRNKTRVKFDAKQMQFRKSATAFHPWLIARSGFQFELDWPKDKYGLLKIQLGANSKDVADQGAAIMLWGENVSAGRLSETNGNGQMTQRSDDPVKVKVELKGQRLSVSLNGRRQYSSKINITDDIGVGIQFFLSDLFNQDVRCTLSKLKMLQGEPVQLQVDPKRKSYLLTIPRLKTRNLPRQILCAANRDMVRGQIVSMTPKHVMFEVNNIVNRYDRDLLSSMIWIDQDEIRRQLTDEASNESDGPEKQTPQQTLTQADATDDPDQPQQQLQLLLHGGRRITMRLSQRTDERLIGTSEALGRCEIPLDEIYEIRFGKYANQATDVPYSDWIAKLAPKPKLETPGTSGQSTFGTSSPLIGKSPQVSIDLLDGTKTSLGKHLGKVIVLDFWATWCGPCVKALPQVKEICDGYPEDDVLLLAINQAESKDQIQGFLDSRQLDLTVGLDTGEIGEKFDVEAIPQTVIIDQAGQIRFVSVGASADLEEKLKQAIDSLLAPPTS